mmetsp:Transcript_27993/g.51634  ORF Transcript_27993/g.51634 Transcript_27993/m.51634 type:complete len:151 (+) Transcript_27993:228-680(+)|eukprot:CAMPEP_0202013148 /NCGR_PEP_ID=MMETSP0905-20130828/25323_1 /ASSEMBLY_ACC=CAM_ASM_000554 /TAXON_ID=420261 /ORGANISM="Thalassiosira antarctica, Strain CCMP982" /LENGTH=150 /DNA_ID=CAMNT_0048572589 /DNA_START=124 /DNA_END=576 /DNA_ORIENTATION=+
MNMKPSGKGKSRGKAVAKGKVSIYNGVALPKDATQRRRMRNKLSAQVHRKRKQEALDSAKQEVEGCDEVTNKLKVQLNDTRSKITSLQSIMDAIKLEFGDQTVQHILQQCNLQVRSMTASDIDKPTRSVTSDSDTNISSSISSSSDEESL